MIYIAKAVKLLLKCKTIFSSTIGKDLGSRTQWLQILSTATPTKTSKRTRNENFIGMHEYRQYVIYSEKKFYRNRRSRETNAIW